MSKKSSKKKARKKSNPRKGKKAPFKQHGSRGIRASQARATKKKRGKKKRGKKGSFKGYSPAFPTPSSPAVALTPAARKRARKAAAAAGGGAAIIVPVPAGYTGALPGVGTSVVAAPKPAKKKRSKKKATSSAPASRPAKKRKKKAASAAPAAKKARKKKSRRAKKGTAPKINLMRKWGFPNGTRAKIAAPKRAELREAAGGRITFNDIMTTIKNEKLKSWVCVGPRRTGCGGGAKNLRGGHQIGVFRSLH